MVDPAALVAFDRGVKYQYGTLAFAKGALEDLMDGLLSAIGTIGPDVARRVHIEGNVSTG